MASVFTKIINGDIPSYKIAEDEHFYAFLDIRPLAPGHTLVVPKKEIDYLFDLEDDMLGSMMVFAKKVARALDRSMECVRVGILVVGTEVPHAHIHLIPFRSESDMNIKKTPLEIDKAQMTAIAEKIRSSL